MVVLELTISARGVVDKVLVVEGEQPFADAVVSVAKTWRFEPAKRNGVASAARVRFTANMREPVDVVAPNDEASVPAKHAAGATPRAGSEAAASEGTSHPNVQEEYVEVEGKQRLTSVTLSQAEIRELPGAFGDPFRALELLPGVTPIASGLPYYYVRGAPPGNVGYFFDGIGVPTLFHFALGPAVLHPAFIERVDLFAGAYPARYGRFSGGIAAGEAARPRYERRAEFSVRLVDSGAMAEVPFADGRGSVMAGGRFSYTGALLSLFVPDLTLAYWDYQLLTRYKIDACDELEVLAFGSGDLLKQVVMGRELTVADITFHRLDLRWDRQLQDSAWRHALTLGYDKTQLSLSAAGPIRIRARVRRSKIRQRRCCLQTGAKPEAATHACQDPAKKASNSASPIASTVCGGLTRNSRSMSPKTSRSRRACASMCTLRAAMRRWASIRDWPRAIDSTRT